MKLESIAIWDEKELFYDTAAENLLYGLHGSFCGCFSDTGILQTQYEQAGEQNRRETEQQFSFLCSFLMSESGAYLFRSAKDMEHYCTEHMHDHVLYPFNGSAGAFGFWTGIMRGILPAPRGTGADSLQSIAMTARY